MDRLATFWVTFGYIGWLKPAPGSWGSLAGLIAAWYVYHDVGVVLYSLIGVAMLAASIWLVGIYERTQDSHDASEIVIDEVLGIWLMLPLVLPFFRQEWLGLLLIFIGFRWFDITKPGLIGWADTKVGGAWGTILDDLLAGIYALVVILAALIVVSL